MTRRKKFEQFEHLTAENPKSICYLYCFDPPYIPKGCENDPSKWAGHYLGSSPDFENRESQHGGPEGARLMQVQREAGGTWHLVRTWIGGREKEFQLKTRAPKAYCPDHNEHPLPGTNRPRENAKYLSRKQRRERQAAREARENDPWKDLQMQEMTCAQVREKLGRSPEPAGPELSEEEQLRHIEQLEANWRRAAQQRQPQMELEAGLYEREGRDRHGGTGIAAAG
jgi:hypothetical protein